MKAKSKHKLIYLFCLILCFLTIFSNTPVFASSADIIISSEKNDYDIGDYVDIYIDIEAEIVPGDFEGCLTFPSDVLEYVSGPEIVVEGEGEVIISDSISSAPNRNSRRYSLRFKAISGGRADICFEEVPELYEYEDGYLMSVSVNEISVSVRGSKPTSTPTPTPKPTPTNEATPTPDKTGQSGTEDAGSLQNDTKENDPGLKDGSGNAEISENSEKKRISAAENGDEVWIYTENGFRIHKETEGVEVPEGYERTSMVIDGVRIPVYTSDDPEAYMLIPIEMGEGVVMYSYDRTEKTLQRYKEKTETVVKHVMTDSIEALELANSYEKSLNVMTLIIAILGGLTMSLLIIVIRMALKHRGDDSSEF